MYQVRFARISLLVATVNNIVAAQNEMEYSLLRLDFNGMQV